MAKNKDFKLVGKARPSPLGLLGNKEKAVLGRVKNFGNFANGWFFLLKTTLILILLDIYLGFVTGQLLQ